MTVSYYKILQFFFCPRCLQCHKQAITVPHYHLCHCHCSSCTVAPFSACHHQMRNSFIGLKDTLTVCLYNCCLWVTTGIELFFWFTPYGGKLPANVSSYGFQDSSAHCAQGHALYNYIAKFTSCLELRRHIPGNLQEVWPLPLLVNEFSPQSQHLNFWLFSFLQISEYEVDGTLSQNHPLAIVLIPFWQNNKPFSCFIMCVIHTWPCTLIHWHHFYASSGSSNSH